MDSLIPFEKAAIKEYLDKEILYWRRRLEERTLTESETLLCNSSMDAYQKMRLNLFGAFLPEKERDMNR